MNRLEAHGFREVKKQLSHRRKTSGLDTLKVDVTRANGKHKMDFTGSPEQVVHAQMIIATWG